MRLLRKTRRAVLLLAAAALLLAVPAVAASAATGGSASAGQGTASAGTGWIRLAHLSPDTPAMDVYLYSYRNSNTRVVLHHVSYGTVSAYQTVPAGDYSVAMRPAGSTATSTPVLSGNTWVRPGKAYTAAAVGPESSLKLQVLTDDLTTPAGKALVRVIQASLKAPEVTVSWDGKVIASALPFASATSYQAVSPGQETVAVTASTSTTAATKTTDSKSAVMLTAGSVHTLVVLDGAHGLEVANLENANGSTQQPKGGAETGFGGTAPHGPGSPLPWLEVIAAGALLAVAGGLGLRRGHRNPGRDQGHRPLSPRA